MSRSLIVAVIGFAAMAVAQRASAVCFDDTAHYVKQGYHVNEMWPWPYVCPDRMAVREPFCMMINNGWRRENLLGAHHFNPETNQLNAAGQLRIQWIMTQAPPNRRQIFVERSLDSAINSQRIDATRAYAVKVSIDNRLPQIVETSIMFEGRPATIVDATNVKFQQAMPAPVLPAAQGATTGSSSGAQ
jgi:hypothetical protein